MSVTAERKLAQHTIVEVDKLMLLWLEQSKTVCSSHNRVAAVTDALLDLRSVASVLSPPTPRRKKQEAAA